MPGLKEKVVFPKLDIKQFYTETKEKFKLEEVTGNVNLDGIITTSDVYRPSFVLIGYTKHFLPERIQILGITELSYLESISEDKCFEAVERLFSFNIPCVIVCKGLEIPQCIIDKGKQRNIPVFRTPIDTTPFIHQLTSYLENKLAPYTTIHGTLVDIFGMGVLLIGDPAIGKSECALDLVERGHRLVADDVVIVKRKRDLILIGQAAEHLGHHMEIRGLGIINVEPLFGIKAGRLQKRIEVVVELELFDSSNPGKYSRTGLENNTKEIMGVAIPSVLLPVTQGKNLTVILEVIALHFMLKAYGRDVSEEFNENLKKFILSKQKTSVYLSEDEE